MEEKIQEIVNALQADGVKVGKPYKGYTVYVPYYNKNPITGYPYVILVKGSEMRLSTPEESLDYLEQTEQEQ